MRSHQIGAQGQTWCSEMRLLCCAACLVQVIYIAPLKALVRERMNDWGKGMCKALGKKLVELTGEHVGF